MKSFVLSSVLVAVASLAHMTVLAGCAANAQEETASTVQADSTEPARGPDGEPLVPVDADAGPPAALPAALPTVSTGYKPKLVAGMIQMSKAPASATSETACGLAAGSWGATPPTDGVVQYGDTLDITAAATPLMTALDQWFCSSTMTMYSASNPALHWAMRECTGSGTIFAQWTPTTDGFGPLPLRQISLKPTSLEAHLAPFASDASLSLRTESFIASVGVIGGPNTSIQKVDFLPTCLVPAAWPAMSATTVSSAGDSHHTAPPKLTAKLDAIGCMAPTTERVGNVSFLRRSCTAAVYMPRPGMTLYQLDADLSAYADEVAIRYNAMPAALVDEYLGNDVRIVKFPQIVDYDPRSI